MVAGERCPLVAQRSPPALACAAMVALLKCPNCGAPVQGSVSGERRACGYCGALLQLPSAPPAAPPRAAPPPPPAGRSASRVPVAGLVAGLVTVGFALVAGLTALGPATPAARGAVRPAAPSPVVASTAPQKPKGVAWERLAQIDIHATTDAAKLAMKQQFPEATVQQDKEYRFDLEHPILSDVFYDWDWGCACLQRAVFFFKDYPTRMKTQDAFIPCLVRGLGAMATSAPPFDYEWAAHADVPRVHLGPQTLSIDVTRSTSQASYQRVLGVLGGCRN